MKKIFLIIKKQKLDFNLINYFNHLIRLNTKAKTISFYNRESLFISNI